MNRESINKSVLLLVVLFISAVFLSMIRHFLMAIFLAGIFSALAHPLYLRLHAFFKGKRRLASLITILMIVFLVLIPLLGLLGIVTAQAVKVGQAATPWIQEQIAEPGALSRIKEHIPFFETIAPYKEEILRKAGQMVGTCLLYTSDAADE